MLIDCNHSSTACQSPTARRRNGQLPTLDDVYRKFGEASEAAQLLETERGTLLLWEQVIAEDLLGGDGERATEIMGAINSQTLGTLLKNAKGNSQPIEEIAALLDRAVRSATDFRIRLPATQFPQKLRRGPGVDDAGP